MNTLPSAFILSAACLLVGCNASMPQLTKPYPSALVVSSCPTLANLQGNLDGSVTLGQLEDYTIDLVEQYNTCRKAALGGKQSGEPGLKLPASQK